MMTSTHERGLDELDRAIVNRLQEGLPLEPAPFEIIAVEVGCTEAVLLERLELLLATGVLTRFGPFFDAEAMGGAFCLCAMAVPPEQLDEAAMIVNARREVAHNYERDHELNMWFVLATETKGEIAEVANEIESATGHRVHLFPKLEEFFIGFKVAA